MATLTNTIVGLLVMEDETVPASRFEAANNTALVDELNTAICVPAGGVVLNPQKTMCLYMASNPGKRQNINVKLSMLTGEEIRGNAILLGWDEETRQVTSLDEDLYNFLIGR